MKAKIVSTSDGGVTTIKYPALLLLHSRHRRLILFFRSTIHDDLQGTGYWPATYDGRAIIGEAYNEHASGASVESLIEKYKAAGAAGQHSRRIVWWYVYSCSSMIDSMLQYHRCASIELYDADNSTAVREWV